MIPYTSVNHNSKPSVAVNPMLCVHCGACVSICPTISITLNGDHLNIEEKLCTACERCVNMCPLHALSLVARSHDIRL